jgi:3-hydroxyisobutyrate dehydrogenase-like beta-hydroxyacid dehydrogenase
VPEPATTRIPTPPDSVIVVHVTHELSPEDVLPFATELQHQTGLPVIVVDKGATVTVSETDQAEAALRDAIADAPVMGRTPAQLAADLLIRLAGHGWELIRLRQP